MFLGCQAQMFQRQIVQVCADGQPRVMNILDPDLFPYTRVNESTFPSPDPALKRATPPTSDPAYATKIVAFVRSTAPGEVFSQPVHFGQKFFNAISSNSSANAAGVTALLDLEVWGAPISKPTPDPKYARFIYQFNGGSCTMSRRSSPLRASWWLIT